MKTSETINLVCSDLGITKAELAKRMGILPSSLYRKLARESMTLEEFQQCLDVVGVEIEFSLKYPDGNVRSSQNYYEMLLKKLDLLETELEAARKETAFNRKSLRDLRTALNSAVGYAELGRNNETQAIDFLNKIQTVLQDMETAIIYTLGENAYDELPPEDSADFERLPEHRVLLVDDNETNRVILKEILLEHGLLVEEAGNGVEALEILKAQDAGYFHFVLMDIEMPVMDGYEATMQIRKLPNRIRANIPVIALTANAFPEDKEKAVEVGMDEFLTKPINSARLLKCLAKFL